MMKDMIDHYMYIHEFDEVGSTNRVVKDAIERGEGEGFAVTARVQTAGYGRQGRTWASPEGGMYLSVLLRPNVPPRQLPTLSLVVGLAVRNALAKLAPSTADDFKVKWPNDVVVTCASDTARRAASPSRPLCGNQPPKYIQRNPARDPFSGDIAHSFHKICGISCEAYCGAVCVGIGVNVLPSGDVLVEGKNSPDYLSDFCDCSIGDVRDAVLQELSACYKEWCAMGFVVFQAEYNSCSALSGLQVQIQQLDGSETVEGVARGVNTDGELVLQVPAGGMVMVNSGEAHIVCAG